MCLRINEINGKKVTKLSVRSALEMLTIEWVTAEVHAMWVHRISVNLLLQNYSLLIVYKHIMN